MKTAILINDTSQEYHIGCYNVIRTISRMCRKNDIRIINKFTRHDITDKLRSDTLTKMLNTADIIIINGEGSLHHFPTRSSKWFPMILNQIPSHKKVVLINTVWQNMKKLSPQDIKNLDKLDLISVRESFSYNNLMQLYPYPDKIIITPDVIFAVDLGEDIEKIGYGGSAWRELRIELSKEKLFFPLNFIHKGTYRNIGLLSMPSLNCYKMWLKSLNLYVTGRFHGVCIASMVGVPFLAIPSNSHKIQGILQDMGCSELLINSLKEMKNKKELAIKLAPKAHQYAIDAKGKIETLFRRINKL